MLCTKYNPFLQPIRTDNLFGKFDVTAVDNEAARISKVNVGKGHEYCNLYVMASHLYNTSIQYNK